jgi:hypothetical protein
MYLKNFVLLTRSIRYYFFYEQTRIKDSDEILDNWVKSICILLNFIDQ